MSEYPPYINAYGYIGQVLEKIQSAPTPPKFTQDFLKTKLGIGSSSARPIIPFLVRIGFLASDGAPLARYNEFRNPTLRGAAAADGIKQGYSQLYGINEYAHDLPNDQLRGLIVQATGLDEGSSTLRAIAGSFSALKQFARFDEEARHVEPDPQPVVPAAPPERYPVTGASFNLGYTINLNLPETTNPAVFDAIFKSLRNNLLKQDG